MQMLKGELSEEMRERWEWDREFGGTPSALIPKREMVDL